MDDWGDFGEVAEYPSGKKTKKNKRNQAEASAPDDNTPPVASVAAVQPEGVPDLSGFVLHAAAKPKVRFAEPDSEATGGVKRKAPVPEGTEQPGSSKQQKNQRQRGAQGCRQDAASGDEGQALGALGASTTGTEKFQGSKAGKNAQGKRQESTSSSKVEDGSGGKAPADIQKLQQKQVQPQGKKQKQKLDKAGEQQQQQQQQPDEEQAPTPTTSKQKQVQPLQHAPAEQVQDEKTDKPKNKKQRRQELQEERQKQTASQQGQQQPPSKEKQQPPVQQPTVQPSSATARTAAKNAKGAGSGLLDKMRAQLAGGRFRSLNEELYTCTGDEAYSMMQSDPSLFEHYHSGFQQQTAGWPNQPLDMAAAWLKNRPAELVVVDFGCGEGRLATIVKQKVHSFDLVSTTPHVVACNMASVPLSPACADVAVFSLALMGTDYGLYLQEAARVLRHKGWLWIAEVRSRFAGDQEGGSAPAKGSGNQGKELQPFLKCLAKLGFNVVSLDTSSNRMFFVAVLRKVNVADHSSANMKWPELKACVYKKR